MLIKLNKNLVVNFNDIFYIRATPWSSSNPNGSDIVYNNGNIITVIDMLPSDIMSKLMSYKGEMK